jgi:hypothetical protein
MTKSHHESFPNNNNNNNSNGSNNSTVVSTPERLSNANNKQAINSNSSSKSNGFLNVFEEDRKSNFLTTSRIIRLFGAGVKAPEK